ncbi:hypothetical protein B0H19DRAFT_647217 [Mycena capillaripes]|nr:hypothetical protein B0H19DRAFT_647217 [Mycena capillaripes]
MASTISSSGIGMTSSYFWSETKPRFSPPSLDRLLPEPRLGYDGYCASCSSTRWCTLCGGCALSSTRCNRDSRSAYNYDSAILRAPYPPIPVVLFLALAIAYTHLLIDNISLGLLILLPLVLRVCMFSYVVLYTTPSPCRGVTSSVFLLGGESFSCPHRVCEPQMTRLIDIQAERLSILAITSRNGPNTSPASEGNLDSFWSSD